MLKDGPAWALGAMPDALNRGVRGATMLTDGRTIMEFGETGFRAYSRAERQMLGETAVPPVDTDKISELVETSHARLLATFEGVELIGFHGLDQANDADGDASYQAGSGDILANVLRLPVVWDFCSADLRLGGQGAPIGAFFKHACARWIGAQAPVVFLDIDRVAQITWVDPALPDPASAGAVLAFDAGPGDGLITADQTRAPTGKIANDICDAFLAGAFYRRVPPKLMKSSDLDSLRRALSMMSGPDTVATVEALIAASVAQAREHLPSTPSRLLVSGPGRHNMPLMARLAEGFACPVEPFESVGLSGDMVNAQAMAYLAVRVLRGLPTSCPSTTGVATAVGGGQVSWPSNDGTH